MAASLIQRTHNLKALYVLNGHNCLLSLMEHIKNPFCLTHLSLSGSPVVLQKMATGLPQFTKLKTLDLSRGEVNTAMMQNIATLTNLTHLNLFTQHTLKDPPPPPYELSALSSLTKLRRLHLSAWEADVKPGVLQNLTNLEAGCFLYAGTELLNELWPLTGLKRLTLATDDTKVSDGCLNYVLLQKTGLERLKLYPSLKQHDLTALPMLTRLTHLEIPRNGTDQLLQEITILTRLEHLGVGSSSISDEGLAHIMKLTSLVGLNLAHNNGIITKEVLLGLTVLKNLMTLVVPAQEEESMRELFQNVLVRADQWNQGNDQ